MDNVNPPRPGYEAAPRLSLKDKLPKFPLFVWLILLFLFALLFSVGIYIAISPDISLKGLFERIFRKAPTEEPQNIWSAYTTTPPPIATGKQLYKISGGDVNLPLVTEVLVDPLDPQVGQNQTVTVKANGPTPIREVVVVLRLDNENNFEFKLAQSSGSPTNGEWKGTWPFPHSYNLTYRFNVKAMNESNLGNLTTITIR